MEKLFESLGIQYFNEIEDSPEITITLPEIDFKCSICLELKERSDGLRLCKCSHTFCKSCLKDYIINQSEGVIPCPSFDQNEQHCGSYMKDFELKYVLSDEEFVKIKENFLRQVELQLKNPFHCKTLNCIGFCSIDTTPKTFNCPVCTMPNCVACKLIHKGQTCFSYKVELRRLALNAHREEADLQGIDELCQSGDIMKCPRCSILLQKRDGQCHYIRCFYCKMDICWLTRGPRWGPGGKGDTSGGCKCGVDGKRCHPECTNCH